VSAVLERRVDGVILRYADPTSRHRYHDEQKPQRSDRLRNAVLVAEREVRIMWIIAQHIEISDVGLERLGFALKSINAALNLARDELGLA
jgi:hypothetical protein